MRLVLLLFTFLVIGSIAKAQNENAFDFWVGTWEVSWTQADGKVLQGSNLIEKTLGGSVIQEHFEDPNNQYLGTSISVYNPKTNTWHQAWADNQGAYYDFVGILEKDRKIFSTDTSQSTIQRMVFYQIEPDQFLWDWEKSTDHGENYTLVWRLEYKRKH